MTGYDTPAPAPHDGTNRALRLAVGAAAVVVLLLGLSQLSRIVGPFFLALNLMVVVWPVQRFLSRRMPRVLAAILSGLFAIVIIGLLFWAVGWAASLFVQEIPQYKGQFQSMYDQALTVAAQFGITSTQVIDQLKTINPGSVVSVVSSLISNVSGAISLFVIVITVLLFMVVDSVDFEARLERLGRRHDPVLVRALESFALGVRRYWVTSTAFGLIVSVLTWVGLAAYGIPLAVVWAVLAFVTNYIPNIGFILGLIPAAVMGLLAKGPWGAVFVIVLYAVLNFVIQGVIQPKVAGEAVGVTSTVSFLSLLVWAVVLGPLGALLALPATLFVKALVVDADPKARWLNALIASNPRTSSEEPVLAQVGDEVGSGASAEVADEQASETTRDPRRDVGSEVAAGEVRVGVAGEGTQAVEADALEPSGPRGEGPRRSAESPETVDVVEPAAQEAVGAYDAPHETVAAAPPAEEPAGGEKEAFAGEPTTIGADVHDTTAPEPFAEPAPAQQPEAGTEEAVPAPEPDAETDETGTDEGREPEDRPRRARLDQGPYVDDDAPVDDFPVFQKSATPYWPGAMSHADD